MSDARSGHTRLTLIITAALRYTGTMHFFMAQWHWWQLFAFTFGLDWVLALIIQRVQPAKFWRPTWKTAIIGDIFLPIGVASSVVAAQAYHNPHVWFMSLWWNWLVLIAGTIITFVEEFIILHKILGKYTLTQELAPSNIWHTLAFIVLFYMTFVSVIPAFLVHSPAWTLLLMCFGYGGWLATLIYDFAHPAGVVRTKPQ